MNRYNAKQNDVVSARITALILGSPRLRQQLLPEGPLISPYEILDYRSILVLKDQKGAEAVFQRTQRVRFLQDGVEAILDSFWGDGVLLTAYRHSAGAIADSFKDEGRRHLVIALPRRMRRGEVLTFTVSRTVMEGFTGRHQLLETVIDHPLGRLDIAIRAPQTRRFEQVEMQVGTGPKAIFVASAPPGGTLARIYIPRARSHTRYALRWRW